MWWGGYPSSCGWRVPEENPCSRTSYFFVEVMRLSPRSLLLVLPPVLRVLSAASSSRAMTTSVLRPPCAEVVMVPMFQDNYGHILIDRETNSCACVDPAEPLPVMNKVKELGLDLKMLLITHKHNDHVGGNAEFAKQFPGLEIYGTKYEAIPCITHPVGDGDEFAMGGLRIRTLFTPCHTAGHVVFYVTGRDGTHPVIFTGMLIPNDFNSKHYIV